MPMPRHLPAPPSFARFRRFLALLPAGLPTLVACLVVVTVSVSGPSHAGVAATAQPASAGPPAGGTAAPGQPASTPISPASTAAQALPPSLIATGSSGAITASRVMHASDRAAGDTAATSASPVPQPSRPAAPTTAGSEPTQGGGTPRVAGDGAVNLALAGSVVKSGVVPYSCATDQAVSNVTLTIQEQPSGAADASATYPPTKLSILTCVTAAAATGPASPTGAPAPGSPGRGAGGPTAQQPAVVPQVVSVYDDMSAQDNLRLWGVMVGLRGLDLSQQVDEILQEVGLTSRALDVVGTFPAGLKQRLTMGVGLLYAQQAAFRVDPAAETGTGE